VTVSGALRKGIMREGEHYFRFSRRERENRGLDGGCSSHLRTRLYELDGLMGFTDCG
jgi:hypothetical protein